MMTVSMCSGWLGALSICPLFIASSVRSCRDTHARKDVSAFASGKERIFIWSRMGRIMYAGPARRDRAAGDAVVEAEPLD
jgi:hypothetical protein